MHMLVCMCVYYMERIKQNKAQQIEIKYLTLRRHHVKDGQLNEIVCLYVYAKRRNQTKTARWCCGRVGH